MTVPGPGPLLPLAKTTKTPPRAARRSGWNSVEKPFSSPQEQLTTSRPGPGRRRGQEPLESGVDPGVVAVAIPVQDFDGDPAGAGGDADALPTDGGAQGVGAVAVAVYGVEGAGNGVVPVAPVAGRGRGDCSPGSWPEGPGGASRAPVSIARHDLRRLRSLPGWPTLPGVDAGDVPVWVLTPPPPPAAAPPPSPDLRREQGEG